MPNSHDLDSNASEVLLRTLRDQGVEHIFANLGTDHTPLLEQITALREAGEDDAIPDILSCPHEFVTMSAAHGYAAATGLPQAVLVHVDVGTQNLGAAVHNAHRAKVPLLVMSGLAPVSNDDTPGARDHVVHWLQDVFDQPGIVREYCRWTGEYRPPADLRALVTRALERATSDPAGPVYLSATREALETSVEDERTDQQYRAVTPAPAESGLVNEVAQLVAAADRPLIITSRLGAAPSAAKAVESLVSFAEAAGAGVVEHFPTALSFPRDHDLHLGLDPAAEALDHADLVLVAAAEVPWVPVRGEPGDDVPVVQIDADPTKSTFPQWGYDVDLTVTADPSATIERIADVLDPADGEPGREVWREISQNRREKLTEAATAHREAGRLTAEVLSEEIDAIVDEDTIVVEDAVTNAVTIQDYVQLSEPGSFHGKGGAGLGFAGGGAVGVKMAMPDKRVLSLVGDGSYVFSNPTATAWLAAAHDAPTLTVIYDNGGWQAVESSTVSQHPDGVVADQGLEERTFDPALNLSAPANVVDAHTEMVTEPSRLPAALEEAVEAVDSGTQAVLDVKIEEDPLAGPFG